MHWHARVSPSHLRKERQRTPLPPTEADGTVRRVRTHCPYCAYQCGMLVGASAGGKLTIAGDPDFPVNAGALCVKGWTAAETLSHAERLRAPLVRNAAGRWCRRTGPRRLTAWRGVSAPFSAPTVATPWPCSAAALSPTRKRTCSASWPESCLRTANIDYNGRFCMSSAAAAGLRAFGLDRGLPFPVVGHRWRRSHFARRGNVAETMPPIMRTSTTRRRPAAA